MTTRIHCQADGWGWIGTCPHCSPSCACGRYCPGPYLAGHDENGVPQYSSTPVALILDNDDEDDDWRERQTSEDDHIMWN